MNSITILLNSTFATLPPLSMYPTRVYVYLAFIFNIRASTTEQNQTRARQVPIPNRTNKQTKQQTNKTTKERTHPYPNQSNPTNITNFHSPSFRAPLFLQRPNFATVWNTVKNIDCKPLQSTTLKHRASRKEKQNNNTSLSSPSAGTFNNSLRNRKTKTKPTRNITQNNTKPPS